MPFFVYVLLNPQGKTYVGQTAYHERRLNQHNDPTCRLTLHTKRHPGPWRLHDFEECSSR
jgi:predicted GIY-YIG superfamily endonuclease